MAAVDKLGYTPDASARKMRGMRNQLIALSSPIRGDINKAPLQRLLSAHRMGRKERWL